MITRRITQVFLLAPALLLGTACNDSISPPLSAVASVTIAPAADSLVVGKTVQLTAATQDAAGHTLTGRAVVWTSSDTTTAKVTAAGLVTGLAVGSATITATSEGKSGTAALTLIAVAVPAQVTVLPSSITTLIGGSVLFQAYLDSAGFALDDPVTWTSSNPAVAIARDTLDFGVTQGLVTGVSTGSVTITATSLHGQGTATIVVAKVAFVAVSAGGVHSCGLTSSGAVFCWGNDNFGALGAPITTDFTQCLIFDLVNLPCSASPVGVTGGLAFATVRASAYGQDDEDAGGGTCGLTAGGAAYCWGLNANDDFHPAPVVGPPFTALSVGFLHTCGLSTTGAAYCWGLWNSGGQLGSGDTVSRTSPTPVTGGLTFKAISAGNFHTCGLVLDGAAYCWGSNSWYYHGGGWLGTGDTLNRAVPTPVIGALTFAAISAGGYHTCALTTNGVAYCWGSNSFGQLGTGDTVTHTVPTPVAGGLTFAAISAGNRHTCGLTTNGVAYCWGQWNPAPLPVAGGLTFTAISAGGVHTCGLTSNGTAYCWGGGLEGQLGNGAYADRSSPTKVIGQP
jgi:alpha-tubulin suppressor-like RCC1 family protein